MLLRRFRDKILEDFLPTIDETKSAEERKKTIYKFMCDHYEGQSKLMIEAFRRHLAWESRARHDAESEAQLSLDPHADSFDMTSFLNQPPIDITELEDRVINHVIYSAGGGQSIVFRVPGWETCSMRQLARLRILDEYIENEEMLPGQRMAYAGQSYYNDLYEREEMRKKGKKEASEETLERYLKGLSLDHNMFWE